MRSPEGDAAAGLSPMDECQRPDLVWQARQPKGREIGYVTYRSLHGVYPKELSIESSDIFSKPVPSACIGLQMLIPAASATKHERLAGLQCRACG